MTEPHAPVSPYLLYEDATAALAFLSSAFGFEECSRITAAEGGPVLHAEMAFGSSVVMLGQPGAGFQSSAKTGIRPILLHVYVDDVDAHVARARAAGAEIVDEPADQPYGDRRYSCRDSEGHHWFFAQRGIVVATSA